MKSKRRQAYDEYLAFSQQARKKDKQFLESNTYVSDEPFGTDSYDGYENYDESQDEGIVRQGVAVKGQRSKYSAKIDRFLNNGIIITGVLLMAVLAIAFLV